MVSVDGGQGHIGCAVDYEPTDTLIHDKNLYHLKDLANWQGAERASLANTLARANDFASIQTAFKSKSDALSPLAPRPVSMPFDGVWTENRGKIKTIERTAFNAVTGNPIIPGSALKGVFRTAFIEQFGEKGSFDSDPFRQLKIADSSTLNKIITAIAMRKTRHKAEGMTTSKNVQDGSQNYVEVVLPGQKNIFACKISNQSLGQGASLKPIAFKNLVESICMHTFATIETELDYKRNIDSLFPLQAWWVKNESTLQQLKIKGAALIRIGRHAGSEQLSAQTLRRLKNKPGYPNYPTTATMAFDGTTLAPFGFALLIPDYARAACDPLLDALLAQMPAEQAALAKAQQAHTTHVGHATAQRQQWVLDAQAAQQAAADQAQAAKAQAAAAQAALDKAASQSPQQNAIDELVTQCVALQPLMVQRKGKLFGINDAAFSGFKKLVLQAADPSWNDTDKKLLADTVKQHLPTLVAGYGDDKDGRKALKKLLEPLNLPAAA
jgi:hypothetical protein